jgi:hypothetical protein
MHQATDPAASDCPPQDILTTLWTGPRWVLTKKEPMRKAIADEEVPFSLGTCKEG